MNVHEAQRRDPQRRKLIDGGNWQPDYSLQTVRRELEIVKHDLQCTAVRTCSHPGGRLAPQWWNKSPEHTLAYTRQLPQPLRRCESAGLVNAPVLLAPN
jgi:hypothetical protein